MSPALRFVAVYYKTTGNLTLERFATKEPAMALARTHGVVDVYELVGRAVSGEPVWQPEPVEPPKRELKR